MNFLVKAFKYFMVLMIISLTISCTHYMVPRKFARIGPKLERGIPDKISEGKTIALINVQEDRGRRLFHQQGFHRWVTDFHEVTNKIIEGLRIEYGKRGVIVTDNSEKQLRISVEKVYGKLQAKIFYATYQTDLIIAINSSDGKMQKTIMPKGETGHGNLATSFRKAIRNAIIAILTDEQISNYINS